MPSSDKNKPQSKSTVATGRHYEQLAAKFFEERGFQVLQQNYRAGSKEIDLVVRRDNLIVFVEVKSVASQRSFGHPAERVDRRKTGYLVEAARQYMSKHDVTGCDFRFDVVTFVGGDLEHYPDAFQAED